MSTFDSVKADPGDAHKVIANVAKALGLAATATHDEIETALAEVFGAVTGETTANDDASHVLSASEKKAADAAGCTYANFLAVRSSFRRR